MRAVVSVEERASGCPSSVVAGLHSPVQSLKLQNRNKKREPW